MNDGYCETVNTTYFCRCDFGYTGVNCETEYDICSSLPCKNGGICSSSGSTGYSCSCNAGYTGVNCETATFAPNNCFDTSINCLFYSLSGYCKDSLFINSVPVTKYCSKSCNSCDEVSPGMNIDCRDKNLMCSFYSSRGYCSSYYFVNGIPIPKLCPNSCNFYIHCFILIYILSYLIFLF